LRGIITKYIFEPVFWNIKKMPIHNRYKEYRKLQYTPFSEYKSRQSALLKSLLKYAALNLPFYKDHLSIDTVREIDDSPLTALRRFKILEKDDLRNRVSELYLDIGRGAFANSSGGSTGQPVAIYQDKLYQTDMIASTYLTYEWAGKQVGDSHALLWGAERDLVKGSLGFRRLLADFLGNRITLNAFRLNNERMNNYAIRLNKFQPLCLEGYAESLYEFSRFIDHNKIEVASPKTIVSSAGTLYPEMRLQIEKTFRSKVFDRYGSREVGNMAAECEQRNGLHVFGETTVIEVVDEFGNEVREGEEGEILVTSLTNYTMPLIRYRIGDRAVQGSRNCRCGRPYPKLAQISGRSGSSIYNSSGGVVSPEFFIHLIGVMHNYGNISKFQIIQEAVDHIVIRVVPFDHTISYEVQNREAIEQQVMTAMGEKCRVEIRVEESIEPTPTGKHLYTISKLAKN
jgi:phenylacetate-CoA ligase